MFSQLKIHAKPGAAQDVNLAWTECGFAGYLLSTEQTLAKELQYLRKAGAPFVGLEMIKSVEALERARPHMARDKGEIVIRVHDTPSLLSESREKVAFIMNNMEHFERVTGLRIACRMLNLPIIAETKAPPVEQISLLRTRVA